jgi:hypothetical protein
MTNDNKVIGWKHKQETVFKMALDKLFTTHRHRTYMAAVKDILIGRV